ncbi:RagB/SusD family nutrient uptake outer membrane protein [Saccharicrinis sp. 156]|uniref:RagB/SusD family nutrient uptake outer membrane protein n=1 Tax=Saccharicrinis sp. 156 TaxID=3417574 RepID=UPI003D3591EA
MNKIGIYIISITLLLFTACDKFIELDPLDEITEAAYYNTPEHFRTGSNLFYKSMVGMRRMDAVHTTDYGSDLIAYNADSREYGRGVVTVPLTDDTWWDDSYTAIRNINILLQKAEEYEGDKTEIAQYVATAYFFRAYQNFILLQRYGGVPIITTVVDVDSEELEGQRNSRYEVVYQILSDLDMATTDLLPEQSIAVADKGKISKWAAEALKAKVLLYEATWEKYVGTTTDGDGETSGAGSVIPEGYPSVDEMLAEAISLSIDVIDNGGYELWNHNEELDNLSMLYLFNLEDEGSNPAGLTKESNNEFILYTKYDFVYYQGNTNISHGVRNRLSPSRKFLDMFLCTDGLPANQSDLFQGYATISSQYQNRDYRLTSYFCDFDTWDTPADNQNPVEINARKFHSYPGYRDDKTESFDFPQIRLAEVYLTFAEATYELNGSITNAELDYSINKVRARSGVAGVSNEKAAAYNLDLKEEIRRERTVELFAETNRYYDLKRWGIAEQELNADIFSHVVEGTILETDPSVYNSGDYPYGQQVTTTADGELSTLLVDPASNRHFERKHYLMPIPSSQINLSAKLLQNPGY